jgi:FlaA1/EpsC-like NDP-sugar epimerase
VILENKTLLVTGGTGSLGKVAVRRVLSGRWGTPAKVIVLSRDEAKQHEMRLSYLHKRVTTDEVIYENFHRRLELRIGDVRDYGDVCRALRGVDIVLNAAALKQVPTCEYFPEQAVLTNCVGAMNITRAITEHGYPVETVVAVSTDKACKPVNVMGMSKALQERIVIAANVLNPGTRFISVRYGNVLASRGSVIPLFHAQIRQGGPVTVTSPEMTRFLISLDQAVEMIMTALADARAGETWVPICPSASVLTLAEALIDGRGTEVVVTGTRPGEKLDEILISEEEIGRVRRRGSYYAIASALPELAPEATDSRVPLAKEYSSADGVIGLDATKELLERHELMVDQQPLEVVEELLR